MAWIESHTILRTNKKLKMLCDELKINRREGIGLLHCLWWWTIDNRESGDLSDLFDKDIANACDWGKDSKKLVKTLHKCRWLIDYKINNWDKYAGRLIKDRERKRLGRVLRRSEDVSLLTEPNQTVPNRTVKEKDPVFNVKDEQIIRKDIAKTRAVAPESEAATFRFQEIIRELGKVKNVDSALALARYKALNQ